MNLITHSFIILAFSYSSLVGINVAQVQAQTHEPVKWHFMQVPTSEKEAMVIFTASLEKGWYLYSQVLEAGGPLPTTFTFSPSSDYTLLGKVQEESTPVKGYNRTFLMHTVQYSSPAMFSQHIKLHVPLTVVRGKIQFMVCNDEICLPPGEIAFNVEVRARTPEFRKLSAGFRLNGNISKKIIKTSGIPLEYGEERFYEIYPAPSSSPSTRLSEEKTSSVFSGVPLAELKNDVWSIPLWLVACLLGFAGGLATLFMPCIFPMIPFTTGYFVKCTTSKKISAGIAVGYGLSIIIIYGVMGLMGAMLLEAGVLNHAVASGIFSLLSFLLLFLFAVSLLGAFDMNLPGSWTMWVDSKAHTGKIPSSFFMAATLALASFSCTGPITGTLLIEAIRMGSLLCPVMGMLGFSLALALPFMLFTWFPSWLRFLPPGGKWLNGIKVTVGFLVLALALAALLQVDRAYQWQWLDREIFLVLWIIIFGVMGLYLLGKLQLPYDDDETKRLSLPRLLLAIVTLSFALYMIPGLWGAPLKALAPFLPPKNSQDFDLQVGHNVNKRLEVAITIDYIIKQRYTLPGEAG